MHQFYLKVCLTSSFCLVSIKASVVRCTNGQFFMPGKVLKTIYFLKGSNADNSNLIILGLEKQREVNHEA